VTVTGRDGPRYNGYGLLVTDRNQTVWAVYPVAWCRKCGAERPHHGPYCCSCGTDRTETARCQHVSPSPWGPTQCALARGHAGRHAYSPSESLPEEMP
jgi:hypothetical protein